MNDGILSEPIDLDAPRHKKPIYAPVAARPGLVVEHRASGTVGAVVSFKPQLVVVRDRYGRDHSLQPRDGAFMVDGKAVALRQPEPKERNRTVRLTASGSVDVGEVPAKVASPSRIWVEGIHDAELIEKVWGDDLRIEGVVVEQIEGMDDLAERVRGFGPRPGRRLGLLLDHLVDGSRESRMAATIVDSDVMITGHPYVDVWQSIKPGVAGIERWPSIPLGTDWKLGIMASFNFVGEPGVFWKGLLARVSSYRDLEQPLVGAVEQLIDFVATPAPG